MFCKKRFSFFEKMIWLSPFVTQMKIKTSVMILDKIKTYIKVKAVKRELFNSAQNTN